MTNTNEHAQTMSNVVTTHSEASQWVRKYIVAGGHHCSANCTVPWFVYTNKQDQGEHALPPPSYAFNNVENIFGILDLSRFEY